MTVGYDEVVLTTDELDEDRVRERIRHTLEKYSDVTVSMLAVHIRPYHRQWRKVLEAMVDEEEVIREVRMSETKTGGIRTSYVHHLA